MANCINDMSEEELNELYDYVKVLLGGGSIDVDIEESELNTLVCRAIKIYQKYIAQWYIENNFSNIYGTSQTTDFTRLYIQDNFNLAQKIASWFASMSRIGGNIPWKKDYIELHSGQQTYNLSTDSHVPFRSGSRRIHKILWFQPGYFNNYNFNNFTYTYADSDMMYFTPNGVQMGGYPLYFLGTSMDYVLLKQALEERYKILYSEYFYNISGDILELTPVPGQQFTVPERSKLWYYYFDEEDLNGTNLYGQPEELFINSPMNVKFSLIPFSELNDMSKTWIEEWAIALAKYVQGSKWRKIKTIASPESDYQVELDYSSLLDESKTEQETLVEKLMESLEKLKTKTQLNDKVEILEAVTKINRNSPKKPFIG